MAERNASNVNDFPLQKAVKLVISGVKKSGQISENDFKARLVVPYELSKDEVAELVNKFEDSGISIVDELDNEVDARVGKDVVGLAGKFELGRLLLVLCHISHTHLHEVHIVGVDFLEHVVESLAHGAKSK